MSPYHVGTYSVDRPARIFLFDVKADGRILLSNLPCNGKLVYFSYHLKAYGRYGLPYVKYCSLLLAMRIGQRSTFIVKIANIEILDG